MFGLRCVAFIFILTWQPGIFLTSATPSWLAVLPRSSSQELISRDDSTQQPSTAFPVNSNANVSTITNTTALIRDRNGVDITSNFRIKVYNPPPVKQITNISEVNQLNTRTEATGGGRTEVVKVINRCPGVNKTFVESHCTPHEDDEKPFQAFVYTCEKLVDHWSMAGEYLGLIPAVQSFHDHCQDNELCVDGFGEKKVASCVYTSLFDDFMIDKDGTVKGMLGGEIFDVGKAWAVIMEKDKENAPLKAKKMGIDSWNSAASSSRHRRRQHKSCAYCAELETDLLQPQTDSLRLEATLMSAGAIAGTIFLAMGAG